MNKSRQFARALIWQLLYSGRVSIVSTIRYLIVNTIVAKLFKRERKGARRNTSNASAYDNVQWHNVRSNTDWSRNHE